MALVSLAAASLGSSRGVQDRHAKVAAARHQPGKHRRSVCQHRRNRVRACASDTAFFRDLKEIDCVSGGAITNAVLYCLARIPGVTAHGRIIEPDTADLTNLNRYMLLLRSSRGMLKAVDLARMLGGGLRFQPVPQRYVPAILDDIAPLWPTVIVGVDHIPTRWAVQQAMPDWLAIGATTRWSAMASFHAEGLGCARAFTTETIPRADTNNRLRVLLGWSLTATYLARHAAGQTISRTEQQVYLTPFRPDHPFRSFVSVIQNCPTCGPAHRRLPE